MSFTATLYNTSDDPKTLNKSLGEPVPVGNIEPTKDCDVLNPTFILDYNGAYTSCNYLVAGGAFNRRYFITDMSVDIGSKITISCAVDVLGTYSSYIGNIETTIYRNEDFEFSAPYLPDTEYQVKSGFSYEYNAFVDKEGKSPAFNGKGAYSYVLSWIGNPLDRDSNYIPIYATPGDWATSWGDYYYKDDTGSTYEYYSLLRLFPYSAPDFEVARYTVRHEYQSDIYAYIGGGGE